MEGSLNPVLDESTLIPARWHQWLASSRGRFLILALAACFSLPASFANLPSIGLDPSWQLSLALAAIQHKVFGQEFVFTYGPLGWLLIHVPVSKLGLLLYDFFILTSLLSIYRRLLSSGFMLRDALTIIVVAFVTKAGLLFAPSSILFTVFCYWLWRVYNDGDALPLGYCLTSSLLLFYTKVNYGLIMIFLVPIYGAGFLVLKKNRRLAGLLLLFGFPLLIWLGAILWHVDLFQYLRAASELIAGYSEAMFLPVTKPLLGFELACLFLAAMCILAFFGRHHIPWLGQAMILPVIAVAGFLLFKNSFLRFDIGHLFGFFMASPLLLAVWCIAWRFHRGVKAFLFASLLYPLVLLGEFYGYGDMTESLPFHYMKEAYTTPWYQSSVNLQNELRTNFPQAVLSKDELASLRNASVDVMPWESSIAIINGLNLKQRPVPQSYSTYTPWLDALNARFISSKNSPDDILYVCAQISTLDSRPAAWDESIAKRALLENYTFESEFKLPMRTYLGEEFKPADVFLLKHTPGMRRLIPINTNQINLSLNQSLNIPVTTNLLFLTLNVDRTLSGRLKSCLVSPSMLSAIFRYQDGSSNSYRAVLPILKTGVLINRRVESPDEIRNWLQIKEDRNPAVSSICFSAHSPWAFKSALSGTLVEYSFSGTQNSQ